LIEGRPPGRYKPSMESDDHDERVRKTKEEMKIHKSNISSASRRQEEFKKDWAVNA